MTDRSDHGGTWYAANITTAPARPRLATEIDVDVCVIGAGLAGLTAAREIARRGWSVVVLEARRVAWAASGRNTGFVLPGFNTEPDAIIERVGREQARALWALSEAGVEYVRSTIREHKMPGVELSEEGWLHVSKQDDHDERMRYADTVSEFGAAAEYWPTPRVRQLLASERYFSAVQFKSAFSINPLNYALGLATLAEAAGARIFEDTPALEIDPAGVRKRITTPSGRVRAAHVVLAGNAHLGRLMPKVSSTLIPINTYVLVTEPLGDRLRDAIRTRAAVSDTDLADNHYRVVGGDRLMWSGRATAWVGQPRRYAKPLLADLHQTFPQLGDVKAEMVWTGTLGNTVHRMPQIGELSPGLWLLSGFGGQGLNTTAMGGDIIASAITDGAQTWRLFSPFELVWAGGALGRVFLQGWYLSYRARARFATARAMKREAALRASGNAPEALPPPPPEEIAPPVVPDEPENGAEEAAQSAKPRKKRRRKPRKKAPAEAAPPELPSPSGEEAAPPAPVNEPTGSGS